MARRKKFIDVSDQHLPPDLIHEFDEGYDNGETTV